MRNPFEFELPTATSPPYDYANWVAVDELGVRRLVDANTGSFVDPNQLPSLVLEDERLRSGVDYLQEHQGATRLRVVLGRHAGPEDLDAGLPPEVTFDSLLSSASVCLYEFGDWSQQWQDWAVASIRRGEVPRQGHPYVNAVIRAALKAGIPFTCFDGSTDYAFTRLQPGEVGYVESVERSLGEELIGHAVGFSAEEYRDRLASWCYLREGAIVARIGCALKDMQPVAAASPDGRLLGYGEALLSLSGRKDEPQSEAKEAVVVIGSAHRDIVRKLKLLGVHVEQVLQVPDLYARSSPAAKLFRTLETGVIDHMPLYIS